MAGERGSEQWLKESFKKPIVNLEAEHQKAFLELARTDGVRLIDWTTRGIPKPDILHGTLQVEHEAAEKVFTRLVDLQHWIRHEWFPIGIVEPDGFLVNFTNHRQLGR
jgi:hypothetical protein